MIAPRLNLPKPKTFEFDGRQWCVKHPETCVSDRGGLVVRDCPFCQDGAA